MSRERFRKALLPPGAEMYKTTSARYAGQFGADLMERWEKVTYFSQSACLQLETRAGNVSPSSDISVTIRCSRDMNCYYSDCGVSLPLWSSESGPRKFGSAELHDMLAEYIYSESPEPDMARVCFHFSRGRNPNRFASTLVSFMGKCYPSEDDLAIARAILM
ncbi:Golgi to ER traffic protein 4 [Tanacetum coccineum]